MTLTALLLYACARCLLPCIQAAMLLCCGCRPAAKETLSGTDCAMVGIPADLPALVSQKRLYMAQLKQKPEVLAKGTPTAATPAAMTKNRREGRRSREERLWAANKHPLCRVRSAAAQSSLF